VQGVSDGLCWMRAGVCKVYKVQPFHHGPEITTYPQDWLSTDSSQECWARLPIPECVGIMCIEQLISCAFGILCTGFQARQHRLRLPPTSCSAHESSI